MKVSLLNEKITFQVSSLESDSVGNRTLAWRDEKTFFATVGGESPGEKTEAGTQLEDIAITFTVRYCAYTAGVTSLTHRIMFRDDAYDIVGVDHQNCRRKSLKFLCRKERTDGKDRIDRQTV